MKDPSRSIRNERDHSSAFALPGVRRSAQLVTEGALTPGIGNA